MLAVTALLAATSLAACSGSDDPESNDSPSASDSPSADDQPFERTCTVDVTVTGAVTASWQGEGRSSNEAGPTMYHGADGKNQITVYAGKDDVPTSANLTVDGATYTTGADNGVDAAGNGTEAAVDADTTGVDGPGPHVAATFTCGKGAQGKGKG
ncbi:hypothetical protein GCM10009606_38310 [Nocardioides aquiterrae]|uniref:Ig-like domain-containing protein n=2 Tax=Nocardioides aquiterrae TaxID=203799 RepID=A0ABP4F522_9ACTN